MNLQIFFDALSDLKDNRRLSSDAAKIFEPFLENQFSHSFIFTAVNSTFTSRLDEKYSGGKTVTAKFEGSELECTILFPSSDQEWVEGLSVGESFECNVKVLELDNLYQRAVLGKIEHIEQTRDLDASSSEVLESDIDEQIEPVSIYNEESTLLENDDSSDDQELEEKNLVDDSVTNEKSEDETENQKKIGLVNEIVNLHKDNNRDLEKYQDEEIEKTDDNASEEIYSISLIKSAKSFFLWRKVFISKKLSHSFIPLEKLKSRYLVHLKNDNRKEEIAIFELFIEDFFSWWDSLIKKDMSSKFHSVEELERKYIAFRNSPENSLKGVSQKNVLIGNREKQVIPPAIPSLNVQKKAKEIDQKELQRIRDKRYDEGINSLSQEEKEILGLTEAQKSSSIAKETENKEAYSLGCRGTAGVFLLFGALLFYGTGLQLTGLILLAVSGYVLYPFIKKANDQS